MLINHSLPRFQLLNELSRRLLGTSDALFHTSNSASPVTNGVDLYVHCEDRNKRTTAVADVEGVGVNGPRFDSVLLAVPVILSTVIVFSTTLNPAAGYDFRKVLADLLVTIETAVGSSQVSISFIGVKGQKVIQFFI